VVNRYSSFDLPMKKTTNRLLNICFRDLTSFGGFVFFALLLILVLALKEFALFTKLLFGFIFTLAIVVLIRTFYFKNRPKKQNHHNFIERIDASSFPSLHAARMVFICITFIYIFQSTLVTAFLILFALVVSYSRMYLKKHDWKDIVVGILLGVLTYWLSSFI
jgi:undecaprenyl-diphosphatase